MPQARNVEIARMYAAQAILRAKHDELRAQMEYERAQAWADQQRELFRSFGYGEKELVNVRVSDPVRKQLSVSSEDT